MCMGGSLAVIGRAILHGRSDFVRRIGVGMVAQMARGAASLVGTIGGHYAPAKLEREQCNQHQERAAYHAHQYNTLAVFSFNSGAADGRASRNAVAPLGLQRVTAKQGRFGERAEML